ncbi:hypothetical protein [Escherichia phage 4E8]|nr:hypothetical protein [Escherichia phage 4E8]
MKSLSVCSHPTSTLKNLFTEQSKPCRVLETCKMMCGKKYDRFTKKIAQGIPRRIEHVKDHFGRHRL